MCDRLFRKQYFRERKIKMKLKNGYILRKVANSYVVVALGEAAKERNVVITLNETGAFLWEKLSEECNEDTLTDALLLEYDIDEGTARADVKAFMKKIIDEGLAQE